MKWFKHISDSLDDPFIQDLMDDFGSDGYLVFFGMLEILSREFKVESPGKVELSRNYIRRKLRLSWHKCSTILKFCEKNRRFFITENGDKIDINCPKLKDMCDDWTQRQLRSYSEVTPKKPRLEEEVEEEEDNNKKKKKPVSDLVLPDWLDINLWKEFKKHRTKLKKPMTEKAEEILIAKLSHLKEQGHNPKQLLITSIERGWQTVYEPKGEN